MRNQSRHVSRLGGSLALMLLTLAGCDDDRSRPPERTSPRPVALAELGTERPVFDRMRDEPTWYDPDARRVFRLRDGRVEAVQERTLTGVPDPSEVLGEVQLRAWDDGSFVIVAEQQLHLFPMSATPVLETVEATEIEVDGAGIDDFWYVAWFLDTEVGLRLCHRTATGTDCATSLPNAGGYTARVAVANDGAVFVTDRDEGVFRHQEGVLVSVGRVERGVRRFRPAGAGVLALGDSGVYALEGSELRLVHDGYVHDVVGTPDDFVIASYDAELVKVDPECRDGWLTSCERRTLWSEWSYERVRGGRHADLGHETCETDTDDEARREACTWAWRGLGIDGDRLVVLGHPLRAVSQ